ncbi:M14 family metallopeptidase [Flagellimonas sp.]|uniref:M14 family metallopeptidase n=1 Tax=Flagellimonas sp. TaxID=2058762 RepID=UPI003B5A7C4D
MSAKYIITVLCLATLMVACKPENGNADMVFDTSFKGARLSKVENIGEKKYVGYVHPESEPVNKSPWFAFAVTSKVKKNIELRLEYGTHKHRYIPKLSTDKVHWKPMELNKIKVDTTLGTATLLLEVSPKKLYVAAQEIETSVDTYGWMKKYVDGDYGVNLKVAGKTALNNANYVLEHEKKDVEDFIVLVARQHPPEIPGGTIGFKSFYETVFSSSETAKKFREKFNIYTFPLLNPDGADKGNWRHNANGVDLNRDWIDFTQPETKMVRQFVADKVEQGGKIRFALDFHTSYSGPYMLVLDSINETKTSGVIPKWIETIESTSSFKVEARQRSQELPYCYNYFFNTYVAEAVTYEEGDEINRDTIRKRASVYAEKLMQTLLEKQKNNAFTK